jgi:2-methylcitrate dehydratase PrpD
LAALSPAGRADRDTPIDDLGAEWRIVETGVNVKKYPMCYATHRSIDAIADLIKAHNLKAGDVAGVDVTIGKTQAMMLRNHRPQTGLEAKFSMEFAMASALVARRNGLAELTDEFVRRPEVQATMEKVAITTADTVAEDDPIFAAADRVEVKLADGRRLKSPDVEFARGHWELPLSRDELWVKFHDCAETELGEKGAQALFGELQALDRLASFRDLRKAADLAA